MLLGNWKNVTEIEATLNIAEVEAIVSAAREREHRQHSFMAALKGIDIDENSDEEDAFTRAQRRAESKLSGRSEEELSLEEMGIDVDTE